MGIFWFVLYLNRWDIVNYFSGIVVKVLEIKEIIIFYLIVFSYLI